MRVFVSSLLIPSSTNRRMDLFASVTRTAVAFARWDILIPAAKKKEWRLVSLKQNNLEGFIGAPLIFLFPEK